jgi:DNA-binding winged helix-turn-helix (wHTH) protein/tetratricopeptide (TPR) repeat protein
MAVLPEVPGSDAEPLRFGPFSLDPVREELRRGDVRLHLPRQPFRILHLLASRPGEVVTREEIQQAIWGTETWVDFEQGINSAIRQIRFILGDNSEAPHYVRTLPRRGYTFVAPVERGAETRALPVQRARTRPRRWMTVAAAMVIALATGTRSSTHTEQRHLIAIAPFRVLAGTPPIEARAFAEELRAAIGTLPSNRIALVAGSGADVVVEGTIERAPNGVRVIVSAIDAASRTQLWSDTYERPLSRLDSVPFETANRVMAALARLFLPPPRNDPPVTSRVSAHALELYRQARLERLRSVPDRQMNRAALLYQAALREEPRFAEAWSGLADTWGERVLMTSGPQQAELARKARDAARRALALQPHNAEAENTLGVLALQYDFDLALAEEILRGATRDDPLYAHPHFNLAVTLGARGAADESLREYAVARQLDPAQFSVTNMQGQLALFAHRYDDAAARYREVLALYPQWSVARWGMVTALAMQRRWAEAIDAARLLDPSIPRPAVADAAAYRDVCRRLRPLFDELHAYGSMNDYWMAIYAMQCDDNEAALAWLDRALANRVPSVAYLLIDPRFERLRRDPRYAALAARLRHYSS